MERPALLLLFLTVFLIPVRAQDLSTAPRHSPYQYIYKITNEEALEFLKKGRIRPDDLSLFHTKVDSFPFNETPPTLHTPGHYLWVKTQGHQVDIEFKTINNTTLHVLDNLKDFSFQIYDLQGEALHEPDVRLGSRKIAYDPESGTYLEPKSNARGWLTYEYQGHLNIHKIWRIRNQGFFARAAGFFLTKAPFTWMASPVRIAISLPVDLMKTLGTRYLHGAYSGIYWGIKSIVAPDDAWFYEQYYGYLVLNKPKYRPGETVRFKAYVTNSKREPINQTLDLVLFQRGQSDKFLQQVQPYAPGGYEGSFVLDDSLELSLDQQLRVRLKRPGGNEIMGQVFDFSDYELKDITLSVSKEKSFHYRGQDLKLEIKGRDENQLPLYDARLEIRVTPIRVLEHFSEHSFVPDTILYREMPLDPNAPTILSIPDSLFPAVNINYEVFITMRSFDNQVLTNTQRLHFYHKKEELEYRLEDSLITFHFRENGISRGVLAQLAYENKDGVVGLIKEVELPHTEIINPGIASFRLKSGGQESLLKPQIEEAGLWIQENRSATSTGFSVNNPRGLDFTWFLYKDNLETGRGKGRELKLEEAAEPADNFHLLVQYVWAGEVRERWSYSVFQPGVLDIAVKQPERIFPGQTATIELEVTDAYGQPAANTDLTAFGWTKKFGEQPPSIQVNNIRRRYPRLYNSFGVQRQGGRHIQFLNRTKDFWFSEAGLDTLLFYHYIFPEKELFIYREAAFSGQTQFAPFVMQDGKQVPVQAIYVNHIPVYTSLANNIGPWSFRGNAGNNHIRLRTRSNEIIIDSLYLEAGQKTYFSLDLDKVESARVKKARPRLSKEERNTLLPLHFVFSQAREDKLYWIEEQGEITLLGIPAVHRNSWNNQARTIIGPREKGTISISDLGGPLFQVSLDPAIGQYFSDKGVYSVSPLGEHFYSATWKGMHTGSLEDEVLTRSLMDENLRRIREAFSKPYYQYWFPNRTLKGNGRLIVETKIEKGIRDELGDPLHIMLKTGEITKDTFFYPGSHTQFENLEPGPVSLVYVFKDHRFWETQPMLIRGNGHNYYKIRINEMPSNHAQLQAFFETLERKYRQEIKEIDLPGFSSLLFQKPLTFLRTGNRISGQVFDAGDHLPLPGVAVTVPGTSIGTITDIDGKYSINVPPGQKIRFQFIGMVMQEFVPSRNTHDVYMVADHVMLDETVVVAYGSRGSSILSGLAPGIRIRGASTIFGSGAPTELFMVEDDVIIEYEAIQLEELPTETPASYDIPDFTSWQPGTQAGSLRSNFSDYAYWEPRLRTDAQGKASFEVKFPDDITYWNTYVYAMNQRHQTGRHTSGIQSFQALTARLSLPRFLVAGDTTLALGRITAYLQDTLLTTSYVEINGETSKVRGHQVYQSAIDTLRLSAGDTDSLKVKYYLEYQGYIDGEERKIPLYPQGLEKTRGYFWSLQADTSFSISFDPGLGEVNLYVKDNPLEYFLGDIEYLIQYPYQCNEQEASRLIGLLMKKQVNERLGRHFWEEGLIHRTIRNLEKNQNEEGLWGWWEKEGSTNIWMSEHVVKALQLAIENGYELNLKKPVTAEILAWHWEKARTSRDRMSLIKLMLMQKVEQDYSILVNRLKSEEQSWRNFYDIAELEQQAGLREVATSVLDSVRVSFFGNLYFRGDDGPYAFHGTTQTNTLAAYRILKHAGESYKEYLDPLFYYLLEARDMSYPRGTYFISNQILTLLPRLLQNISPNMDKARLSLRGAVDSVGVEFPMELQFAPVQPLHITKTGPSPLYLTVYQRYWETSPSPQGNDIRVTTWFEGKGHEELLEAGKEVILKAMLALENEAEYLMLEVPIPAGCSYAEHQAGGQGEVHREQWRNLATLFFQRLGPGTYTYDIKLLPRFSGSYTLNPAKAELMYFPVFNGNNEMRKVVIE